jgi:hypothetical protein
MEIYLALVVGIAVIFFGALISLGNERQRQAIDALREQTERWAIQDLRLKRERLAREVRVDDPLAWLNQCAQKVVGLDLNMQVEESFAEPGALVCRSGEFNTRIIFSPLSPAEIRKMKGRHRNRLLDIGKNHPLLLLPRNTSAHELSVLNGGLFFDLELQLVWKGLTGQSMNQSDRLWMYMM